MGTLEETGVEGAEGADGEVEGAEEEEGNDEDVGLTERELKELMSGGAGAGGFARKIYENNE